MGINGIHGYSSNYSFQPIKKVDLETVKAQELVKQTEEQKLPAKTSENLANALIPDTRSKTADLENISLSFNQNETYDYIGKDAELSLLDMDQVLSDMKKDSVLDQYRYFVGDSFDSTYKAGLAGDGVVFMK